MSIVNLFYVRASHMFYFILYKEIKGVIRFQRMVGHPRLLLCHPQPSMSQEPGVAFPQSTSTGGMKLEAVMEQLQRQQQARLEMERKERKLREAHIMYAQQVAAQQAILAAARASGASFMSKSLAGGVPGGGLPPRVSNQSSVDSEREDDEDRGRDSGDEDDDNEMMEGDEGSDEDEGSASGLEFLRKQTLALQQSASRIPPRPFGSYSASAPQRAASPPIRVKQEPDEGLSPAGPHSATSPNGQADWGFEDHFRQVSALPWRLATQFPPYDITSCFGLFQLCLQTTAL